MAYSPARASISAGITGTGCGCTAIIRASVGGSVGIHIRPLMACAEGGSTGGVDPVSSGGTVTDAFMQQLQLYTTRSL